MKTVLLTRPEEEAASSIARLKTLGIEAANAAMLRIEPLSFDHHTGSAALIVTSRNGVRHGLAYTANKKTRVFSVGERTAAAARAAGFHNIITGERDARALAELIGKETTSDHHIHLAGKHIAFDITAALEARSLSAETRHVYCAVEDPQLDDRILGRLENGNFSAVLFYSARTATIFEKAIRATRKIDWLKGVDAVSLSAQVDAALTLSWHRRLIAAEPNEDALFECLSSGDAL